MEKEFIPYAEALILKELGFDENCIGFYNAEQELRPVSQKSHRPYSRIMRNISLRSNAKCTAPLYQKIFRWFRENYAYQSFISPSNELTYLAYDFTLKGFDGYFKSKQFETYEEAELECLKKLIEIIKKK
jgi:hypothetical protein